MKRIMIAAAVLAALLLTGCEDGVITQINRRAERVHACEKAGGQWFNSAGWGESCQFDTRPKP